MGDIFDSFGGILNFGEFGDGIGVERRLFAQEELDIAENGHERIVNFVIERGPGFDDCLCANGFIARGAGDHEGPERPIKTIIAARKPTNSSSAARLRSP